MTDDLSFSALRENPAAYEAAQALRLHNRRAKIEAERAEYERGERAFYEDPDAAIPCLGGPLDGRVMEGRYCGCTDGCGENTWPVRWAADRPYPAGEYVLSYLWREARR